MKKLTDWQPRLDAYLAASRRTAFVWGTHDCVLFAAGAVAAQTGIDPAAPWRGRYDSALSAARLLFLEFGIDSVGVLPAQIGLAEIAVGFAQRGDIVGAVGADLFGHDAPALGVLGLDGKTAWFAVQPAGLVGAKLARCAQAWRVG